MKRVLLGLTAVVLSLSLTGCALFSSGGNVELGTVQTLEGHIKNIEKDHMKRLTTDEDKDDIGKAYKAAYDAINSLKEQAND
jgi:hypothetical protein